MQHISRYFSRAPEEELDRPKLLLLDYDGTLSPIAGKPPMARLSAARRRQLEAIARSRGIRVGIITGRSLKDIRNLVRVKDILYSANHGFEVYYKGRTYHPAGRHFRFPMGLLARRLRASLKHIPKHFLESKGFSVAVHFRLVPKKYWKEIERIIRSVSAPWRKSHGWKLTGGKKVLEVRPSAHWNKGDVALWIWKKFAPKSIPCYFGDDLTDEDAFKSLGRRGITVAVGRRSRSRARYFTNDVSDVWGTLSRFEGKHKKKGG